MWEIMEIFKPDLLQSIIHRNPIPSISIYMPVYLRDKEIQQNPIRLKNLLGKAGGQLLDAGMPEEDLLDMVKEVKQDARNLSFWQKQSRGLALFLSTEGYETYRLPEDPGEIAMAGTQFFIRPLVGMIQENRLYYSLTLNLRNIQLWRCDRYTREELPLKGIPISIEELLKYEDPEKSLQYHTGTGGGKDAAMFHGQGTGGDDTQQKKIITRFFQAVDKKLKKEGFYQRMNQENAPLLLSGIESHAGIFRELCGYHGLLKEFISRNPEDVDEKKLLTYGWEIVGKKIEKEKKENLDRYFSTPDDKVLEADSEEILKAAAVKRIDTLFTDPDTQIWGFFDPDRREVNIHSLKEAGDIELINLAMIYTLEYQGKVFALKPDKLPGKNEMAAILRY
jgi:hypothetical protein